MPLRMVIKTPFSVMTELLRFFIMLRRWIVMMIVMSRRCTSHVTSAPARRRKVIIVWLLVERRRMSRVGAIIEASSRRTKVAPVTSPASAVRPEASPTWWRTRRGNCDGRRNVGGRGDSHGGRDIDGRGDCHGGWGTMGMMTPMWRTSSEPRRSPPHGRMAPSSKWWWAVKMGRGAVMRTLRMLRTPARPGRMVMRGRGPVMMTRVWMPTGTWRSVTSRKVSSSVRWWRLTRIVTRVSEGFAIKPQVELLV